MAKRTNIGPRYPLLRKYLPRVHEDLSATYSRNLHKWLIIAPIIGAITGLGITGISVLVLKILWPATVNYFLHHEWAIVPGVTLGFFVTGLIMQYMTPNPNEHSTEEIVHSYHDFQGDIDMKPFFPKLLAAVTTVGFGGSAALEGPSIYGGGAISSWLWTKMKRRLKLNPRDRRIMLISGAAAGMAAVFHAPLTGLIFAVEMPYKDDMAHEALLPSLIASVVSYMTLISFLGAQPIFELGGKGEFTPIDLLWCAVLGAAIGLIAMTFAITFRHARAFFVKWTLPHWMKLTIGGFLTGLCGLIFVLIFKDGLIPMGPNYEAVGLILGAKHGVVELVVFATFKLASTLFSLASGGVSAMFVPLFLSGGSLGTAFAQAIVRTPSLELYAAVGMASFIAAGYKTPLAAVTFVAEATGGHAFIIPALIGSAVAYAVSGDASVSGDQRLHEGVRVHDLKDVEVGQVMQRDVVSVEPSLALTDFAHKMLKNYPHSTFPVVEDHRLTGTISAWMLETSDALEKPGTTVRDLADRHFRVVPPNCDAMEALRLLLGEEAPPMLLVTDGRGKLEGIVTKTDLLQALKIRGEEESSPSLETAL